MNKPPQCPSCGKALKYIEQNRDRLLIWNPEHCEYEEDAAASSCRCLHCKTRLKVKNMPIEKESVW